MRVASRRRPADGRTLRIVDRGDHGQDTRQSQGDGYLCEVHRSREASVIALRRDRDLAEQRSALGPRRREGRTAGVYTIEWLPVAFFFLMAPAMTRLARSRGEPLPTCGDGRRDARRGDIRCRHVRGVRPAAARAGRRRPTCSARGTVGYMSPVFARRHRRADPARCLTKCVWRAGATMVGHAASPPALDGIAVSRLPPSIRASAPRQTDRRHTVQSSVRLGYRRSISISGSEPAETPSRLYMSSFPCRRPARRGERGDAPGLATAARIGALAPHPIIVEPGRTAALRNGRCRRIVLRHGVRGTCRGCWAGGARDFKSIAGPAGTAWNFCERRYRARPGRTIAIPGPTDSCVSTPS